MTCASRVVSFRYGSIETMNSSAAQRALEARPPGVDSTGLPARVISARIWPAPAVSISSASAATGSSPPNSGLPRTRLRQRAKPPSKPTSAESGSGSTAGVVNIEAARLVEVARDRVERVAQPRGEAAELLRADADPTVQHGALRGGERAGQRIGSSPAATPVSRAARSAVQRREPPPQRLRAVAAGDAARCSRALGEQRRGSSRAAAPRRCPAG